MSRVRINTIEFTSGHKCAPNGVGDYTLICPTRGETGVVPYMIAQTLSDGDRCPACGEAIGAVVETTLHR